MATEATEAHSGIPSTEFLVRDKCIHHLESSKIVVITPVVLYHSVFDWFYFGRLIFDMYGHRHVLTSVFRDSD